MTKPEILEVVKQMHKDWSLSYINPSLDCCMELYTNNGFCYWLNRDFINYYDEKIILNELKKEITDSEIVLSQHWYFVIHSGYTGYEVKCILLPRINHLQRTITRLENEIKNESQDDNRS